MGGWGQYARTETVQKRTEKGERACWNGRGYCGCFHVGLFWTTVVHGHLACLMYRNCETTVLNKRNELQTMYLTLEQTGLSASVSPVLVNKTTLR